MPTTVTIADEMADQLRPYQSELPEILELGIREYRARREPGYHGLNEVLESLAALPGPEEVLALRPSPSLQERIGALLEKSHTGTLSSADQREWDRYQYVEHLVRLAKTSAMRKLRAAVP